ncbi:MAG TPA: ABC transporter permease [Tepidisphaeraceae bacterium]|jgi:oligopeptide transport system permease protein
MARFIAIRVLQFPLILAIIYLVTFALAWVAPGSPFENERKLSPFVIERLKTQYHAQSAWTFLRYYPANLLAHGDFGPSMEYPEWTVNQILGNALPVSVTLGLAAMLIALLVGVGVGALAAVRRGGAFDWSSLGISLIGISLPSFVTASLLMILLTVRVRWFPIGTWGRFADLPLPAVALSLMPMAYIARLTRVAMIDVLGSDYVRTARAKGLSRSVVIWKHCLRNALLPVLSFLGPAAAGTLTGSFVVEKVFNIPGMGQFFVNSVLNRDQTLILGVVMVYSLFVLAFNLLVDVAYAFVDPRIEVLSR